MGIKKSAKSGETSIPKVIRFRPEVLAKVRELAQKLPLNETAVVQLAIIRLWDAEFPERRK